MRFRNNRNHRSGAALIIVLVLVVAAAVLSLGYLSGSDTELLCGDNMLMRTQMDYLAESALEHAKGLILNPQDVSGEYWTGATNQQLTAGSDDYYNVSIAKLGELDYRIISVAYRQKGGEQVGRSSLQTQLRLDPCIAYWQGNKKDIPATAVINGDVYCADDLEINSEINGDVFSAGQITNIGTVSGKLHEFVPEAPVGPPGLNYSDWQTQYYIGSQAYSVQQIAPGEYNDVTLGPSANNPAGVYYCDGNIEFTGMVDITGMLVVKDDLRVKSIGNVTITAIKNFPALIVEHDLHLEDESTSFRLTGLAQIDNCIDMHNKAGGVIDIVGSLCVLGDGIRNTNDCSISIEAAPDKAAIETWPSADNPRRWSPAAGAFYKSISRL